MLKDECGLCDIQDVLKVKVEATRGLEVVLTTAERACFGEGKGGVGSPIEIEIVGTGQCKRRKFHGR